MMNLKLLLKRPLQAVPISLVIVLLVIAILGFADATYLTIEHFQNSIPPCGVNGGCETVLTSKYATVGPIPISLFGSVYYLLIAIGIFAYLEGKREKMLRHALHLSVFGFLASLGLVYLMAFVIQSWCLYCIGSAITSTLLFAVSLIVKMKYTEPNNVPSI